MSWIEREPPAVECDDCGGNGYWPWYESPPAECHRCRGTGRVPAPREPAADWPITVVVSVGEGVPADAP